jgi:hypothetical protein
VLDLHEGVQKRIDRNGRQAGHGNGDEHSPLAPVRPPKQQTDDHARPECACDSQGGLDDPGWQSVETAEEIRRKADKRGAEEPLDEEDGGHRDRRDRQPEDVGRGALDRLPRGRHADGASYVSPAPTAAPPRRRLLRGDM